MICGRSVHICERGLEDLGLRVQGWTWMRTRAKRGTEIDRETGTQIENETHLALIIEGIWIKHGGVLLVEVA